MEPYRNAMERDLFVCGVDESKYRSLIAAVEWYRDKMIAHADGKAFEMTHGHPVMSHKMIESGIDTIDFDFLLKVCEIMERHIHQAWQPILDELRPTASNGS